MTLTKVSGMCARDEVLTRKFILKNIYSLFYTYKHTKWLPTWPHYLRSRFSLQADPGSKSGEAPTSNVDQASCKQLVKT